MGFTFKENVPDTRNTKVADLVRTLRDFVAEVVVYDPMADVQLAKHNTTSLLPISFRKAPSTPSFLR
jgi:UDP-N-acetyl-D-mannosaminuronate dehydrogenase